MKKTSLILSTLLILFAGGVWAEECITYKNMTSNLIKGELLVVKGTRYWDHGEITEYYIFRMNKERCFDEGTGPVSTTDVQVLLNADQEERINELIDQQIYMKINDFLLGGTHHWKRPIGVPKAEFIMKLAGD